MLQFSMTLYMNDNMLDLLQHIIEDTCIRAPWATPGTRTSQTDDPSTARVAFKSTVQSLET